MARRKPVLRSEDGGMRGVGEMSDELAMRARVPKDVATTVEIQQCRRVSGICKSHETVRGDAREFGAPDVNLVPQRYWYGCPHKSSEQVDDHVVSVPCRNGDR